VTSASQAGTGTAAIFSRLSLVASIAYQGTDTVANGNIVGANITQTS
jgi:hypothetical protein